ncbi:pentatricopeptide repeat-containing protein At3g04130, mitochondrial-like [Macadamia integrifolia]|uniref:pentatricopeptide repeat-containing protein At3g04130, mitochondrial-like n=1 Tax=Macadamia integrifolia TaxID=60698 RepID=UPI001C4FBB1E|nr:pentatricopeptide repeat-containing protein At3g04130, mitochondrial-like [Macadamia integrifolia]
MIIPRSTCLRNIQFPPLLLSSTFAQSISAKCSLTLSLICLSSMEKPSFSIKRFKTTSGHQELYWRGSVEESFLKELVAKIRIGNSEDEVLHCLLQDQTCHNIQISNQLVDKLLFRFRDDWKSALGLFQWVGSRSGYKHTKEAYDKMVDILGKMKQMDRMWLLVAEMHQSRLITLQTIAKVIRRLAGAGKWEDAIETFDKLETLGLEKNTESMNLLLDALCKEKKVELAREVYLRLKSHISPNAHTFTIFIHGWCKANRIDEAHWTIQEMKGHGCCPCVISYSTIIQAYCNQSNFRKVFELCDEMKAQGCPPNVVTYTTIMYSLAKSDEFEAALQLVEEMKSIGCKPDTLFYNALIHILGRAGRVQEAVRVFEEEMPMNGIAWNSSTYNTMISMFCHHSQEQNALKVLKQMEMSTICKPDLQTYNPLLKLCFKAGSTDNSLGDLISEMVNKHHLGLDLSTYTLLLHGLCRENKCEWAYRIFEEMIGQDITPRYQTCSLLLDAVKQKNMDDAAERIEGVMRKTKSSG